MKQIGILGYPLGHTLSPKIHEAGFKELNLDIEFNVWEVNPSNLEKKIEELRNPNILGFCVTLPHKNSIISFIEEIDDSAKEMNAVNWVVNSEGRLKGYNTDWIGFKESLTYYGKQITNKDCLVLGAGGSAKAICMALINENANSIYIYNRTKKNAKDLVSNFHKVGKDIKIIDSSKLSDKDFVSDLDLIINTTSVGMHGGPDPNKSPINTDNINKRALCYDLVYSPEITPFIEQAKDNDIETIGGITMLVFQAIEGFELVTREKAPVKKMLQAVGITKNN
ncbi:MAG: shikimate dehydrogenase [Dehalococcoidia bacterium]|nr:shikimate dehydrogenase [Dehalococcoidia bacterium]|tara:strand:- start:10305 stop:11147 length:843 start_codon:yes stop_codon:yes gene_type:complete